jgi:hypothetical protein
MESPKYNTKELELVIPMAESVFPALKGTMCEEEAYFEGD